MCPIPRTLNSRSGVQDRIQSQEQTVRRSSGIEEGEHDQRKGRGTHHLITPRSASHPRDLKNHALRVMTPEAAVSDYGDPRNQDFDAHGSSLRRQAL